MLGVLGCNSPESEPADATSDVVSGVDAADAMDVRETALLEPTRMTAGLGHTCVLREDDVVKCWGLGWQPDVDEGWGDHEQADPPDGAFVDISAGRYHTCGIRPDLSVQCWGLGSDPMNEEGRTNHDYDQSVPPDETFIEVSAGHSETCGILEDRTVWCWGSLGPEPFGEGLKFKDISTGWGHVCGVLEDGRVRCLGVGSDPDEDQGDSDFDQAFPPSGTFVQVVTGVYHSCALAEDRSVTCWGLGTEDGDEHPTHDFDQGRPPPSHFDAITAGDWHTCGLEAETGEVVCWGVGSTEAVPGEPLDYGQARPPSGAFEFIEAGGRTTCGRRESGQRECWGWNGLGQTDFFSRYGSQGCRRSDFSEFGRYECSPLCQTGCETAETCTVGSTADLTAATRCVAVGSRGLSDNCEDAGCAPGLACWRPTSSQESSCHQICRIADGEEACPDTESCISPGGAPVGVCEDR